MNLFERWHLLTISDLLLSMFLFLSLIITNFSVVHRSHLLDERRYGAEYITKPAVARLKIGTETTKYHSTLKIKRNLQSYQNTYGT